MGPTAGSRSSTDRKAAASNARSEPKASEVRAPASAGPRSEVKPSEGRAPAQSSASEARIALGRVVGAHGLRGGIRVRCFAGERESFLALRRVALGGAEDDPQAEGFDVETISLGRAGELRLDLAGVDTREAAEALRGRLVLVAPAALGPLAAGEYYGYQLLGCRVEGEDGVAVGTVREIWETAANDLLVVEDERGVRHLIPAVLLRHVDVEGRRLVMEILPGLLGGQ
jgi:16S rRNA processing protein RimM